MKNKNIFNRKGLKFYRSSLRNRSTSAEPYEIKKVIKKIRIDSISQSTTPAAKSHSIR